VAPNSLYIRKIVRDLSEVFDQDLSSSDGENLVAEDSPKFLDFRDIGSRPPDGRTESAHRVMSAAR
jgi:hypothetical protein